MHNLRIGHGEHVHAGVKARSILLVLQASLGQVDGKHAGHPDQTSHSPIDQFGRQTGEKPGKMKSSPSTEPRWLLLTSPYLFVSHLCEAAAGGCRSVRGLWDAPARLLLLRGDPVRFNLRRSARGQSDISSAGPANAKPKACFRLERRARAGFIINSGRSAAKQTACVKLPDQPSLETATM